MSAPYGRTQCEICGQYVETSCEDCALCMDCDGCEEDDE